MMSKIEYWKSLAEALKLAFERKNEEVRRRRKASSSVEAEQCSVWSFQNSGKGSAAVHA